MDYITVKEASEKWGVTPRRVNYYCAGGHILGAIKMAGVWLIPKMQKSRWINDVKQTKLRVVRTHETNFFVEDDLSLINGLSFAIKKQGYEIDIARTSSEAESLWMNGKYDLVILDVSLPDGSGYDLCKKIRQTSKVPIIFLTAADEETDIIMGLDIGGDDYITKPFKLAVFLSRVNALLRRSENFSQAATELNSNGITIQLLKHEVYKDDVLIDLTASEYKLLCLFMENPNIVLSSEQILSRLWDCEENYIDNSTLTVYIRRLRTKIEDDPGTPQKIVTVRRIGYKWNVTE